MICIVLTVDNVIIIFEYVLLLGAHKDNNQPVPHFYIKGIEI